MKLSSLILILFFIWEFSFAQTGLVKQWDKRFGGDNSDYFGNLQQTRDGGFILSGASKSGISGDKTQPNWDSTLATTDVWVVKIDSDGTKVWDRRFGGFGSEGGSVSQTFDGGYILGCGSTSGIGGDKTEPYRGQADYWLVKVDPLGNKQWDKCFGGSLMDNLANVYQTKDSGFILSGYSNSPISGDKTQDNWDGTNVRSDFWIVKTDALGNKEWDKRFGGIGQETGGNLLCYSSNNYLIAGTSASDISGDKTQANWASQHYNFWVVAIDSFGNKLWDKRYGGTIGEVGAQMLQQKNGTFILAGYSGSGISGDKTQATWSGSYDYWMIAIDSIGNKLWDKDYGGSSEDEIYSAYLTNDGGVLLSGFSYSALGGDKTEDNLGSAQVWLVKTDSIGNKEWDKTILTTGTDTYTGSAIQTKDGCYLIGLNTKAGIGGYKTQPNWDPTNQTTDYWIVKFCDSTLTDINEPPSTQAQIQIFPNPFSTDVAIMLQKENLKEATFTISNMLGKIVYTKQENNLSPTYTKMLDLSYLPNGLYIVEVVVDNEKIVKRIVKQ